MILNKKRIAIIGLGYVGLPLARLFATKYFVFGFDINKERIAALKDGFDATLEISKDDLINVLVKDSTHNKGLFCSSDVNEIEDADYYIVTVPTPVDKNNKPDLGPLYRSSETVGKILKKGSIVIYESTVYPGVTEEECVPVLEKHSGLKFNQDFFVGYSPERINPGDKEHTVEKILKVTAGSTPEVGQLVNDLYKSVIVAGTHLAPSIRVAEAAKVIENSQRDINIAFVNELSKIFNKLGIDTNDVLQAAGTKWNFLKFKPGLVGGHCIGVDPFYLAQKAQEVGYHPEIILAGRRLNDGMGPYIANEVIKLMLKNQIAVRNAKVLILGFTFKENCPDIRNTRVIDIIKTFNEYHVDTIVFDPWASVAEVEHEYKLEVINTLGQEKFDAVILAVAHDHFNSLDIKSLVNENGVIYDVKGVLPKSLVTSRL